MNRIFHSCIFHLLLATVLSGCVNLNYVNNFSSASLKSVRNFEEIEYGFEKNCLENCLETQIKNLSLISQKCDCRADESADSVTLLIYRAVKGYLDGLARLSDNSLTNYKVNVLTKSLNEGDYKSMNIDKVHADAYMKISDIMLEAFTNGYRRNKIREYVYTGNEPLKTLITFLNFNLSENLTGKLNVQKEQLKNFYFDLSLDSTLSAFEKRKAVEEYYSRLNQIGVHQKELMTYSKILKKVAAGHQKLADNLQKMKSLELIEQLTQVACDLEDLISEYNKIAK